MSQRFLRQKVEDEANPPEKWGADRDASDTEDLDSEDYMPIPHAGTGPSSGKASAKAPIHILSDDDDEDECRVLEALNVMPLAFAYPANPTSAAPSPKNKEPSPSAAGGARAAVRKRAAPTPKKGGTPAGTRQKKRKVSGVKPKPMSVG